MYTYGRWRKRIKPGLFPRDYESCDWSRDHRGIEPRFWRYVKPSACHWLVNFNLRLAQLAEPKRPWRILTSDEHSTVWDGDGTLFDLNYLAMGIHADECFARANGKVYETGREMRVYLAEHVGTLPNLKALNLYQVACLSRQGRRQTGRRRGPRNPSGFGTTDPLSSRYTLPYALNAATPHRRPVTPGSY